MDKPKQEKERLQASDFFGSLNSKISSYFMEVLFGAGTVEDTFEAIRRERQANTFFFDVIDAIEDGLKRALVSAATREAGFYKLLDPFENWPNLVQSDESGSVTALSFPFFDWDFNEDNPWEIDCRFITLWIDLLEAGVSEEFLSTIGQGSNRFCEHCGQYVTLEQIQCGNWSFGCVEDDVAPCGVHINHKNVMWCSN